MCTPRLTGNTRARQIHIRTPFLQVGVICLRAIAKKQAKKLYNSLTTVNVHCCV